jgi:hypothetical protein
MKSKLILLLLLFVPGISFSQGVRGTIVDENGNPLPMVSIYMPSQRIGTTTNLEGKYEISLDSGVYNFVFQSLGYKRREFKLTIRKTWIDLDLTMEPQNYQLDEVVVNPSGEDPAYAIMRKAIGMAPYYLRQTEKYNAEVYLKGSFRVNHLPGLLKKSMKIEVNDEEAPIEEGRTYTMESMNNITFIAPDTFKHTVLASRSSFPMGDESTALEFISGSFYESDNEMIISPLSPQAMRHYKFRYEGYFEDGDVEVNKIKVIPKRKSQQLVSGYLYIVQNLWNLHSVDVTAQMFFGDIRVKQVFQPVAPNAWLPVTHQFDLDISVMGVKAVADYSGSVKYKEVKLNEDLPVPDFLVAKAAANEKDKQNIDEADHVGGIPNKNQQKIDELLTKDNLNNREMMKLARLMEKESNRQEKTESFELTSTYHMEVKEDSLKQNPAYWEAMRPVPLTPLEQESFVISDSLARGGESKADSTQDKSKGIFDEIGSFAIGGRRFYMIDSAVTINYNGLIRLGHVNFNPVDGWSYKQSLQLNWQEDSVHNLHFRPEIAWAFSREALMWNVTLTQTYAPLLLGQLDISAGDITADFKPENIDVAPFVDMAASLLFKENYKRYFGLKFVRVKNGVDLANGLRWEVSASYEWLTPLRNHSNYSFFRQDEDYSSNIPENGGLDIGSLMKQNSFLWRTELSYTPHYFYRIERGRKLMEHSDYPTFSLALEQGVSAFESDADYFLLEGNVNHQREDDFFPAFSWTVGGGWFVRHETMHFSHFKHFNASNLPVRLTRRPSFRLLNDYETSTNKWYLDAHLKYSSPYLLLKNLPVLSNRLWQESLHFDYLHTPILHNYMQAGYSIDQIFLMGSMGVFLGFEDGEYKHWGFRAVLEF